MLKYFLLFCLVHFISANRKIDVEVNPGCDSSCKNELSGVLIHVKATGKNDSLHHVWDLTKKPCLFLALTPKDAQLKINWSQFLWDGKKGSVNFTEQPYYVFSVVFDKLIEFNDEKNSGTFDPTNTNVDYQIATEFSNFTWGINSNKTVANGIMYTLEGVNENDNKIQLSLTAYGSQGHGIIEPHLMHTSNATQVDFVFDKLKTNFKFPRFAVKMVVVSTNKDRSLQPPVERKTLHDEHSPGIFTISELLTPEDEEHSERQGYMQWRNVAYTSSDRGMTNSTDVTDYVPFEEDEKESSIYGTFTQAYFNSELFALPVHSMHVSFGTQGDQFYSTNRYLSWTLTAGIGKPAEESFSMLVIMILTIGLLGIPIVFIAFGVLYLISRRISNARDEILTN